MISPRVFALVVALTFVFSSPVLAEDTCNGECPSGEKRVCFADGNNPVGYCVPEGQMQPTDETYSGCANDNGDDECD